MDSILRHISIITKIHGTAVSDDTLNAEVTRNPNGNINYGHLSEILTSHGFENKLSNRPLIDIPALATPVLILLKNKEAAVITKITGKGVNRLYEVETDGNVIVKLSHSELNQQYMGYCWFIKPRITTETRSELPEYDLPKSWFWKVIWRFKSYYYQVLIATFLINILALTSSFYVLNVYDRVIPNKAFETLWVLSIGVFITILFEFFAKLVRAHLTDVAGKKADLIISSALFRRVMNLRLNEKPVSSGSYANNLRDFEAVRDFATSASILALADLPFLVLYLFIIWIIGGNLVYVPMAIIPLVFIFGIVMQKKLAYYVNISMKEASQRQGLIVEALEGIETLKANNAINWAQTKWDEFTAKTASSSMKTKDLSMMIISFSQSMIQLNTVLCVLVGAYLATSDDPEKVVSMGAIIATVILSGRALAPLGQVASIATRYQSAKLALESVNKIVERPIDRDFSKTYITPEVIEGQLNFKDVAFQYHPQLPTILQNINLNIKPKEKIAIIGKIGSGKSTLLRVASGLFVPNKGQVLVDSIDLRQIDPTYLRNKVYLLGSDPRFFWGTLRENLAMGIDRTDVNDEDIIQCLQKFQMHHFVLSHPKGLDMDLGEDGAGLSSGQKQLLSLARLCLHSPSVALMDEPTANLDPASENIALNTLKIWLEDKGAIIVTHRTSVLSIVDRIIVMNEGKIYLDGPKDEIIKQLSQQS